MAETPPGKQDSERLVREAAAAMQRGDFAGAGAIADRAIADGAEHPFLLKVKAFWLHNTGQYRDALRAFHHARTLDPKDPSILNGIAGCLAAIGEYDAAIEMVDASLAIAENVQPTHYLRGWILEAAGNFPEARAAYARARSFNQRDATTRAGLASAALSMEDFDNARKRANEALAADPRQLTAIRVLAGADIAQDKAAEAETRLRSLLQGALPDRIRAQMLNVLGDALDAQGRTSEAFEVWQSKLDAVRREATVAVDADPISLFARRFESIPAQAWRSETAKDGKASPVFLTGIGIEAIEPAIASVPNIVRVNGSLRELAREHLETADGLQDHAAHAGDALDEARTDYWQSLQHADLSDRVLVERNVRYPLDLPLIAKLFPDAKVLVVVRDPRDAVFEAFRRQTGGSETPLFSLEDCAHSYVAVQAFADVCRTRLSLTFEEARYEDLIADSAGAARALEFIGVKPPKGLPVLSQRVRESAGAWRRYAPQLAPVLPLLEPWIAKLGYS